MNSHELSFIHPDLVELLTASRVDIPGTTNVRDLGGYPTASGSTVRRHVLMRAEALAHPGPGVARVALWRQELIADYRALGLSLVIDLRADHETALAPSAWAEPSGAVLMTIPITEGGEGDATDYVRRIRDGALRSFTAADLATYYAATLRRRAALFGDALRAIAQPGATPVLVHCAAGKDRTGLLIAVLLDVLGVPRDVVIADYALTGAFRPNRVSAYADILAAHDIPQADVSALFETPAAAMQQVLAGVDEEYGSVTSFLLRDAGLDERTLGTLRDVLLTD